MLAPWIGALRPERVASLTIVSPGVRIATQEFWQQQAEAVGADGLDPLARSIPMRWLGEAYRESAPEAVERAVARLPACDPTRYAACCEAIGGYDWTWLVGKLHLGDSRPRRKRRPRGWT